MIKSSKKLSKSALGLCVLAGFAAPLENALASGFGADLYSTSGIATSYAGSSAGSHDISDSFVNPANYDQAKNTQFLIAASYLKLKIDPDKTTGKYYNSNSVSGKEINNAGVNVVVPSLFVATPVSDKVKVGLSITSPYALSTSYGNNWVGRYTAIDSSISSVNFNPAFSYEATDKLSLGAGLQVQYIEAVLTSAVDVATALSATAGTQDGLYKAKGSDVGYGYNLGLKYKITDQVKFGLSYRSKIDHKLQGTAQLSDPTLGASSYFSMKVTTPESMNAGLSFKATDRVELMYDVNWTRWSRVQGVNISAANSALSNSVAFNWHDSWRNSIGMNYKANEKWMLRTGTAYEKDAIDGNSRSPSIPTGNKIWLSFGASYKVNQSVTVDGAYLHQFYRNARTHIANDNTGIPTSSLEAQYKTSVDVISVALKWEFM